MLRYVKKWWSQQYTTKDKFFAIVGVFFYTLCAVVLFILPKNTTTTISTGDIMVFPNKDNAKNYMLPVIDGEIIETHYFLGVVGETKYRILEAEWPNGGTLSLDYCELKKNILSECKTDDGTVWIRDYNIE